MKRALTYLLVAQLALSGHGFAVDAAVPAGVSDKSLIYANGNYYQPFSNTLAEGTYVYVDADTTILRATQRSLGFREVAYKAEFSKLLGFSSVTPTTDANGNTIYNYGTVSTGTNTVGFWTSKDLPIIAGADGNAYITDGHHTTAGYLMTSGTLMLPGTSHLVLGHIVAGGTSLTGDAMWNYMASNNNAYLFGPNGNQLLISSDAGYTGLQPILPVASGTPVPVTPGTVSMANDLYRSLTWGAVTPIVKTAVTSSGAAIAGFKKVDSTSLLTTKPDVNFIEFYWSDFLRNRVVWNDEAAVMVTNLINAPLSFYFATANAIALSKSELYLDQNGRSLTDYTSSDYSANIQTWANASIINGLAAAGDTYNIFLTDDSSINGDILASAISGVTTNLRINTGTGMTVAGRLQNLDSIIINAGASLTRYWKDSIVRTVDPNYSTALTLAAGTGNVVFTGDNDYSKLSSLVIAAGTLTVDTDNATLISGPEIGATISGAGVLRKTGAAPLILSGSSTHTGGVFLDGGQLTLASSSAFNGGTLTSSPVGLGTLTMMEGTSLTFDDNVLLGNSIKAVATTGDAAGAGILINVAGNSVELAGKITADVPVAISGSDASVITLSAKNLITGTLTVDTLTLRVSHSDALSMDTILLQSGATIQAGTNFSSSAELAIDGRLDAGESLLEWTGRISGAGKLTVAGLNGGTVRLSGLNTYTGGTEVNDSRVEVGVNASDAETEGGDISGRAFGSGEVVLNSGVIGFAVSAVIPNAISLNGASGIDVGSNLGQLSGTLSGDGSLYVTGNSDGALLLSGTSTYTGKTEVEGTTLRVFSTAGSGVFGNNAIPVSLNNATLQIIPDLSNPVDLATFGTREISVGALGGTLDVTDNNVLWDGVISGLGKLSVNASTGNALELTGINTYLGGTEVKGGSLVFRRNSNLGDSEGGIFLSGGGLVYAGTQDLTFARSVAVNGTGLINSGSQVVTLTGAVTGAGTLIVGDSSTRGVLSVGSSSSAFSGTTVVNGGSLSITHADALKSSTVEIPSGGGTLSFNTSQANVAGLAGDGVLLLPSGFTLTLGATGASTLFTGSIAGTNATISKVGAGTFTLAGAVSGVVASVNAGALSLTDSSALASSTKLTISAGASLMVSGSQDLSNNFDLTNLSGISAGASIIYYGSQGSVLTLPSAVYEKVAFVNNGLGRLDTVLNGTVTTVSASSASKIPAGGQVTLSEVTVATSLAVGGTVAVDTSSGDIDLISKFGLLTGGGTGSVISAASGGNSLIYTAKPSFNAVINAPLKVPASSSQVELLPLQGSNSLSVLAGGSIKLVASGSFTGTTSLGVGASAELTGSYGSASQPGLITLSSNATVSVNPTSVSSQTVVPAFSGNSGSVGLKAGSLVLSGSNADFGGTITVERGVSVTVKGDLPKGTMALTDPTAPLVVDTSSGSIILPGTISGSGAVELSGSGKMTMSSGSSIGASSIKLGKTASDKPVLDVSSLASGLVVTSSQTLSGGGTLIGSLKTGGSFNPGNSPGVFTVAKSTLIGGDGTLGGNLVLDATSTTTIEYGKRVDNSQYNWDKVVVGGTLNIANGARIVVAPYVGTDSSGVQYGSASLPSSLLLSGVFSSTALTLGTTLPELSGASYMTTASWVQSGGTLGILIEKASYGALVSTPRLQNLGGYLSSISGTASTGLSNYLVVLDATANQVQLEAALQALSSPVYSEAQRISLRRTDAISSTVQGRLTPDGRQTTDGWSAFSESYGWSFHRQSSTAGSSWNANTFGEVAGVEKRLQGLVVGVFGATGYSTASLSGPGSTLKGDSFHGGAFAQLIAGSLFMDASVLTGNAEHKATRLVSLNGLGGTMRSKFDTSEYAAHLRAGWVVPNVAGAYQFGQSLALVCNGYSQGGVTESGSDSASAGVITEKKTANAIQTRLGSDISRKFKVATRDGVLSTSVHWIHDFDQGGRSTTTRLQGASATTSFDSQGSSIGSDAFEIGVAASVDVTSRAALRAVGNWQLRDGSSQPGFNVGLNVKF